MSRYENLELTPREEIVEMYPEPKLEGERELALQQEGDNPFAMEQYQNYGVPDQPITYGGGMAEQLLTDGDVPEKIKKKYWFVFNRDNVLTFLDEGRKASKMLNFDIMKIDMLNS